MNETVYSYEIQGKKGLNSFKTKIQEDRERVLKTYDRGSWKSPFGNVIYRQSYCASCECLSIICPVCENSSCNGGGCHACNKDFSFYIKSKSYTYEKEYRDRINSNEFDYLKELSYDELQNIREDLDLKIYRYKDKIGFPVGDKILPKMIEQRECIFDIFCEMKGKYED